ncbi:MAG: thioredoxin domain-containing protein [Candidatus Paceibacterota bacterium]
MFSSPNRKRGLSTPIAVIIAGVLVAGAVFASGFLTGNRGPAEANMIEELATEVGVKSNDLSRCLDDGQFTDQVEADVQNATLSGGQGTPFSLVIAGEEVFELGGAQPFENLKPLIDEILAGNLGEVPEQNEALTNLRPISPTDHIQGSPDAPVIILEYSDIDCPFCARFHQTMKQVRATYDDDQVAWVFRHFPLDNLHPEARRKAEAAECVAELAGEEAFWDYLNKIFIASDQ